MLDKSVRDAMPSNGFFPAYVKYARTQTDAPDIFHLGTALAMFSAVAARGSEMAIPLSDGKGKDVKHHGTVVASKTLTVMPLHLWVLLVGPSGERKSTAIQIGARMMTYEPPMRVEKSPEATFNRWSKESDNGTLGCCGLLCYPEASALFDIIRKPWWAMAEGFLCGVYDGQTMTRMLVGKARTKGGRRVYDAPIEIKIAGPRIAFLGGTCPALIADRRRGNCVSGLLGRMMPLYGEREWFNEIPPTRRDAEEQRLSRMFRKYALRRRTVDMKPESWAKFVAWAKALDRESGNYTPDKRAMMTRLPQHVLRVVALYRLSIPDDDGTADVIDRALALGDLAKASILKLPPSVEK